MMNTSRHQRLMQAVVAVSVGALVLTACGNDEPDEPEQPPAPTTGGTSAQDRPEVEVSGTVQPPEQASNAFTYDQQLAPVGAKLTAEADKLASSTRIELSVERMVPNRGYAVHAHTKPCGPTGKDAGPHFQHKQDPAASPDKPSTDPAYANPKNEIWLDLRTDAEGEGEATAEVPFTFAERAPASIVVHKEPMTATEPGEAGKAGDRLACLNVPFGG